jgi:hypothetical protein
MPDIATQSVFLARSSDQVGRNASLHHRSSKPTNAVLMSLNFDIRGNLAIPGCDFPIVDRPVIAME